MSGRRMRIQARPSIRGRGAGAEKAKVLSTVKEKDENGPCELTVAGDKKDTQLIEQPVSTEVEFTEKSAEKSRPAEGTSVKPAARRARITAKPKVKSRSRPTAPESNDESQSEITPTIKQKPTEDGSIDTAVDEVDMRVSSNEVVSNNDNGTTVTVQNSPSLPWSMKSGIKPNVQSADKARIRRLSESLDLPDCIQKQLEHSVVKRQRRASEHQAASSKSEPNNMLKSPTNAKRSRHVSGPPLSTFPSNTVTDITQSQSTVDVQPLNVNKNTNNNTPHSEIENQIKEPEKLDEMELSEQLVRQLEEESSNKLKKSNKKARRLVKSFEAADPSTMTIKELIYYQPMSNPLETQSENPASRSPCIAENCEEVQEPQAEEESEEPEPAPQVMIGEDGEIVINQSSLIVHNKPSNPQNNSNLITTYENNESNATTYSSYRESKRNRMWSKEETGNFYRALCAVGSDFTLMTKLFPHRTRTDIKRKFKREEKSNLAKVNLAMAGKLNFNAEPFPEPIIVVENNQEVIEEEPAKTEKRPHASKGKISNRTFYESSALVDEMKVNKTNLDRIKWSIKPKKKECERNEESLTQTVNTVVEKPTERETESRHNGKKTTEPEQRSPKAPKMSESKKMKLPSIEYVLSPQPLIHDNIPEILPENPPEILSEKSASVCQLSSPSQSELASSTVSQIEVTNNTGAGSQSKCSLIQNHQSKQLNTSNNNSVIDQSENQDDSTSSSKEIFSVVIKKKQTSEPSVENTNSDSSTDSYTNFKNALDLSKQSQTKANSTRSNDMNSETNQSHTYNSNNTRSKNTAPDLSLRHHSTSQSDISKQPVFTTYIPSVYFVQNNRPNSTTSQNGTIRPQLQPRSDTSIISTQIGSNHMLSGFSTTMTSHEPAVQSQKEKLFAIEQTYRD